jgi:hypothetical protein
MTTKKGSGGSIPPPPGRPAAPAPPPQPKRPQLRPIGAPKPPLIRPLATKPQPPPPKPAESERLPQLGSEVDEEDATNVMVRPPVDLVPPRFKKTLQSPTESQRPPPARPVSARPARPNIDLVPKTQQGPTAERTALMANAPPRVDKPESLRPPSPRVKGSIPPPTAPPPRAAPTARGGSSGPAPHFPSAPPRIAATVQSPQMPPSPQMTGAPSVRKSTRAKHDTALPMTKPSELPLESNPIIARPGGRPPVAVTEEQPPARAAYPTAPMPTQPFLPPHQDHTMAMPRGNWTPSAPPVGMVGPAVNPRPASVAPPNVRVRPESVAPAHFATPTKAPSLIERRRRPAEAPGVFGLMLFAVPLAFAMAVVAALALL